MLRVLRYHRLLHDNKPHAPIHPSSLQQNQTNYRYSLEYDSIPQFSYRQSFLFHNRYNFCIKLPTNRFEALRFLLNKDTLTINDMTQTVKFFKTQDVKSLIRIEEAFFQYCRLIERTQFSQKLNISEITDLLEICFNLKVLNYSIKSFPRLFRMIKHQTDRERIFQSEEAIDEANFGTLCKLYIVLSNQGNKRSLSSISPRINRYLSKVKEGILKYPVNIDLIIQLLRHISKEFEFVTDERKICTLILNIFARSKVALTFLQEIKIYFALNESVSFLGGSDHHTREFCKNLTLKVKRFPQKYNKMGFETVAFILGEAPTWNYYNIFKLFSEVSDKWIKALSENIDRINSYDQIRKDTYIFESMMLSGVKIDILSPKNRPVIIHFIKKLISIYSQEPNRVRLKLIFTILFDMQFLVKKKYLQELLTCIIDNLNLLPNKIQVIYQLTCLNIYHPLILDFIQKIQWKPLNSKQIQSSQKIENIKLIMILQKYSFRYGKKAPKLEEHRHQIIQQIQGLSKAVNFITFSYGINHQYTEIYHFHRIYRSMFFKDLTTHITPGMQQSIIFYCASMCDYQQIYSLRHQLQDLLSIKMMKKLLWKAKDIRKTPKKYLQNTIQLILLSLSAQIINLSNIQECQFLIHFLANPFLQQIIRPTFASQYYKTARLLFNLFYETDTTKPSIELVNMRKKYENYLWALLKRDVTNIKTSTQYFLFLEFIIEKIMNFGNQSLVHQILVKGLEFNLIGKETLDELLAKEFKINLYHEYLILYQFILSDQNQEMELTVREKFPYLLFKSQFLMKNFQTHEPQIIQKLQRLSSRQLHLAIFHFSLNKSSKHFLPSLSLLFGILIQKSKVPLASSKNLLIRKIIDIVEANNLAIGEIPQLEKYLSHFQYYHSEIQPRMEELNITTHFNLVDLAKRFPRYINTQYFRILMDWLMAKKFTLKVFLKLLTKVGEIILIEDKKYFEYIENKLGSADIGSYFPFILGNIDKFKSPQEVIAKLLHDLDNCDPLFKTFVMKKYPFLEDSLSRLPTKTNNPQNFGYIPMKKLQKFYHNQFIIEQYQDICLLRPQPRQKKSDKIYGFYKKRTGISEVMNTRKILAEVLDTPNNQVFVLLPREVESLLTSKPTFQQFLNNFESLFLKILKQAPVIQTIE